MATTFTKERERRFKKHTNDRKEDASPLLKMMAVCQTIISKRFDSRVARDVINVIKDESFDLYEFQNRAGLLMDFVKITE